MLVSGTFCHNIVTGEDKTRSTYSITIVITAHDRAVTVDGAVIHHVASMAIRTATAIIG